MPTPRQIIYPFRYLRSAKFDDEGQDRIFRQRLNGLLGGASVVVPLGRARSGIYLLVKDAITPKRRKVVLSPYTIPDVINMVRFGGGEPVFVDFVANSTNVDLNHLATLVDDETACVLVTHYHVPQASTEEIAALCHARGAKFFDDCAISLGASLNGRPIGSIGDGSVFSFSGFKILNFFWGGAVAVSDRERSIRIDHEVGAWSRLKASQYLFQAKKVLTYGLMTSRAVFPFFFALRRRTIDRGNIVDILPVSRIETTSLDDSVLSRPAASALFEWNRKFDEIAQIIDHRRSVAATYDRWFRNICVSAETPEVVRAGAGFVNYPIVVPCAARDRIYRELLAKNYDVALSLYPNVHEMEGFVSIPGRTTNVSNLVRSVITLPTHPRVTTGYAEELSRFMAKLV